MFESEDDLGNYVEDPKLWRPVGPLSGASTACPIDRVISGIRRAVSNDMHQKVNFVVHVLPFPILPLLNHHIVCIYIFVLI